MFFNGSDEGSEALDGQILAKNESEIELGATYLVNHFRSRIGLRLRSYS